MNIQSNPCRVASKTLTPLSKPDRTGRPRLWLDLPAETQKQIAQSFARLLLRMRPTLAPMMADRHDESVD
jgi:hypothetical protein